MVLRSFVLLAVGSLVQSVAFAQSYAVSTLAGQVGVAGIADGTGTMATFSFPTGIGVDSNGNIYVADFDNCNIRKITPAGVVSTLAGQNTTVQTGSTLGFRTSPAGYVDAFGTAARFSGPNGLAVDAAGNVYVADSANAAVRKISPAGNVTTLAKGLGGAYAVAVDSAGNVYVATGGGNQITLIAPNGTVSALPGALNPASTSSNPLLPGARGVAVDGSGNVYVAEYFNYDIGKIAPGGVVSTFAGIKGSPGFWDGNGATAQFAYLLGLSADRSGNLYLSDDQGTVIRTINPAGVVTTVLGQANVPGYADQVGGAARFMGATSVAADSAGNLYIADGLARTIRKAVPTTAPEPPILSGFQINPAFPSVGAGTSFTFSAQAEGTAPVTFQWSKNGTPISGATNSVLTLNNLSAANAGNYSVTVSDSAGSYSNSPGPALTIYTPPVTGFTSRYTQNGGATLWSLTQGANGRLVTVGTGGTILTSLDGINWSSANSGVTDWLVAVCYGGGQFVAVGDNGRILLSPDGLTWSLAASSGMSPRLNNVIYYSGQYIAVGEGGTILTSANGQTWTPRTSGVSGWLRGLVANPAAASFPLIATGQNGVILGSADGINWSQQTVYPYLSSVPLSSGIEAVIPNGTEYQAIGDDGSAVEGHPMYQGGIAAQGLPPVWMWTSYPTGTTVDLRALVGSSGALFATGENGTILAAPAPQGPWSVLPPVTSADLVGGAQIGNTVYVVGDNETILQSNPLPTSRLLNISTLGTTGPGENALTAGFSLSGTASKQILLRGSGPALTAFGVTSPLAHAVLTLFDASGNVTASDQGWSTQSNAAAIAAAAVQVGAFPFANGSADSALLLSLVPGNHTAQVVAADSSTGSTLIEMYDADSDANSWSHVVNISSRGRVTAGQTLSAGFVIGGSVVRQILIRGIGPALAGFGIPDPLAHPRLAVYNQGGGLEITVNSWANQANADDIAAEAALVGAFPLAVGSADAALVATLTPGPWTAQVTSGDGTSGIAMVEVYDLP